ncbi:pentapeptide repeat-containing protein [Bradyrhizobium sp. Ghvi]|uniref:pentapeptide repeat-containing protein n=1 Tax=Bradyrhizobium sp. Ghvi TaxID=1855319 RepID=UPI000A46F9A2|nr:pentapeptide repeat-containing protein [Bradyrhizobium sp. Ghvi]
MNVSATFAKFRGANLNDIDFQNANLFGADFSGANLANANLSGANLNAAKYNAGTIWPKGFNPVEAGATLQ